MSAEARPVAFEGCFGWLHPASGDVGVLVCPGLGHDARVGHRSLRRLAGRIAAAGYPTLRFDYPGTGDSRDVLDDDLVGAWLAGVQAAAEHLRAAAGVERLVLCGLRFGATLACLAARERSDVEGLMLLAPVISGKLYARELTITERLSRGPSAEPDRRWLEADGLRLPRATVEAIHAIDLRQAADWPARQTLVLSVPEAAQTDDFLARLASLGVAPVSAAFEGYAAFLSGTSFDTLTPEADFERAVGWLRSTLPVSARPDRTMPDEAPARLEAPAWSEEMLRFGTGTPLSGVLCRPTERRAGVGDWVVVLGNSGGDPRYGYGRFQVELARRLARAGVSSLRFDFAGLGDSANGPADPDPHPYATDRRAEIAAAIDCLRQRGFRRVALGGLCSGAYHVLQAARGDARIDALLLLNIVFFTWGEESALPAAGQHRGRSPGAYLALLRRAETWRRLVRGELRVGAASRAVGRRLAERGALLGARVAEALGRRTRSGEAQRTMRRLSERGTPVLMCLGTDDLEQEAVEAHFGKGGRQLAMMPGIQVRLLPGLDHNLSRARMREAVVEAVLDYVLQVADASAAPETDERRPPSPRPAVAVGPSLAAARREEAIHDH